MSRTTSVLTAALVSAASLVLVAAAQPAIPAYVTAAVNDPGRTAEQRADDAIRLPAAVVAFSGMKPGDKVVDFLPGGGYYTRIFSKVVGPNGHVYAAVPAENVARRADADAPVQAIAADANYRNVSVIHPGMTSFSAPEPVDIVWTSDNYHDMKNTNDVAAMNALNKSIFNALKPGGIYYIVDHKAKAGTGFAETRTLHRIDPEALKAEVLQAGFVFDGESKALDRPADDLTTHSKFETSQFIFRFRKPG